MLKLLTGLTSKHELLPLIKGGVDEFFCGYLPSERLDKAKAYLYLNRRSTASANFTSYSDLIDVISTVTKHDKTVFITFNEHFYSQRLYDFIMETVARLELQPPHGYIVADVGLIRMMRRAFPDLYLVGSTGCPVFNARSLEFFKDLGLNRMTLSIAHTMAEIVHLGKKADQIGIEMEAFIQNEACINTNALCQYLHGLNDDYVVPICKLDKRFEVVCDNPERTATGVMRLQQLSANSTSGCGVCHIPKLSELGFTSVKIDSRRKRLHEKIQDVLFVRELIDACEKNWPAEKYNEKAKMFFRKIYGKNCEQRCVYT